MFQLVQSMLPRCLHLCASQAVHQGQAEGQLKLSSHSRGMDRLLADVLLKSGCVLVQGGTENLMKGLHAVSLVHHKEPNAQEKVSFNELSFLPSTSQ